MRKEKQLVKDFYDTFGWHRNTDGVYNDTASFTDMRPALDEYYHRTHIRVKNFLKSRGRCFLDAGSGAIPHPEYLDYSSTYKYHVCIDLSERALREAQSKLKERGLYVLADLTKLPFKDRVFDSAVSAHVLYHIPQDEQESAVLELYNTLAYGGSCVIIYGWPTCLLTEIAANFSVRRILAKIPGTLLLWRKVVKPILGIGNRSYEGAVHPPLPFHPHDYQWFRRAFPNDWHMDIRSWRSIDCIFTQTFVPNNSIGPLLLRLIFWLEEKFPHALARIGRYPMIIIHKK